MASMTRTPPRRLAQLSALAAVLGLAGGGAAWVLVHMIGLLSNLALYHRFGWAIPDMADVPRGPGLVVAAVLGGVVISLLARWAPAIRGHGIPEAMEAVLTNQSRISPRTAIAKPVSAAVAIGTGGPFGAEGPIIVTGGAMGSLLGQVLPTTPSERKILLACGAAAGMSATFGAPLAAVILAIELLLFEFSSRAFVPLVVASSLAAGVHTWLFEDGPLFHVPDHDYAGLDKLPFYALLGLACGLLAAGVTHGLFAVEGCFRRLPVGQFWHAPLGAVGFAAVGLLVPRSLGVGYGAISDVLASRLAAGTVAVLGAAKLVSWWIALGSGTSGGTLAPLLLISGCFGTLIGNAVDAVAPSAGVSPGAFALVAMAATFGAAVGATFTAIVFLFELTRDYRIILPLMLASVLADLVASALMHDSLMTEKLTRRGLHVEGDYRADVLASALVRDVMTTNVQTLPATATVGDAKSRFSTGSHGAYPVVDPSGHCVGIVARQDVMVTAADDHLPVLEVASTDVVTTTPGDTVLAALERIIEEDVGHLPVVDGGSLVGIVTRSDVFSTRRRQFDLERMQPGSRPLAGRAPWRGRALARAGAPGTTDGEETTVKHYLIVANRTLGGPALAGLVRARVADGPCTFHVLVPATRHPGTFRRVLDAYAGEPSADEVDAARCAATQRLDDELARLHAAGIAATGEVGDEDPVQAVREALARIRSDEILLSTLPAGMSHWLGIDLPQRIRRVAAVPVVHVEGPPAD